MAGEEAVNGNGHLQPPEYEPTETSPLLRKDVGASKPLDASLGGLADAPIGNGHVEAGAVGEEENPMFDGLPEVMARMHWILPAIGFGVSLSSFASLYNWKRVECADGNCFVNSRFF